MRVAFNWHDAATAVALMGLVVACSAGNQSVSTRAVQRSKPRALPVVAESPAPEPGASPSAAAPLEHRGSPSEMPPPVELGPASIEYGSLPPWAAPPGSVTDPTNADEIVPPAPKRWRLLKTIWVGHGYLHHAELSNDGARVLTLSEQEGVLRSYDVKTGALRHRVAIPEFGEFDSVGFVTIDENRETVLVVREPFSSDRRQPGSVVPQLVDLPEGSFTPAPNFPSGDGLRFAGRPGLLGASRRVIDPQSGVLSFWWITPVRSHDGIPGIEAELSIRLRCAERPDDWALSKDGRLLAVSYFPSNRVDLLDLEGRRVRLSLPAPRWGGTVALSPDSRLLALGGEALWVYDAATGDRVAADDRYENNIDTIRFTPQSDLLLTSAYDRKARSYGLPSELETLHLLPRPQVLGHTGNVYALGLTPDGRRLVTSSGDQTLKIWVR